MGKTLLARAVAGERHSLSGLFDTVHKQGDKNPDPSMYHMLLTSEGDGWREGWHFAFLIGFIRFWIESHSNQSCTSLVKRNLIFLNFDFI